MGSNTYIRNNGRHSSRGKSLQLARRVTALVALSLITIYFVTLGTATALHLKWIVSVQIIPAALAVAASLLLMWGAVTFLFGRIYCSTVCPVGIIQDIAARLPRMSRRRRFRHGYRYSEPFNLFRYVWLAIIVLSSIAGLSLMLAAFDPYSNFGRIMTWLIRPLIAGGYGGQMAAGAVVGVVTAVVALLLLIVVSMRRGRLICNTVCPAGSLLSLISRHSVFGIDINTDACINCGLCERVCKAECIDSKGHTVDMSRCVVCFDCTAVCDNGAITYTRRRHRLSIPMMMKIPDPTASSAITDNVDSANSITDNVDSANSIDRRRFLSMGLMMAAAPIVATAARNIDKLSTVASDNSASTTLRPVPPPGTTSKRAFLTKCVGCGACVAVCPAHVLHPSTDQYGKGNPLHPVKDYNTSYCRYNCTQCTKACPTGALTPLTAEEKHRFIVGIACVSDDRCVGCGRCADICPRHTITMVHRDGRRIAHVDIAGCIGCGACQYVCPVSGKAITVDGRFG